MEPRGIRAGRPLAILLVALTLAAGAPGSQAPETSGAGAADLPERRVGPLGAADASAPIDPFGGTGVADVETSLVIAKFVDREVDLPKQRAILAAALFEGEPAPEVLDIADYELTLVEVRRLERQLEIDREVALAALALDVPGAFPEDVFIGDVNGFVIVRTEIRQDIDFDPDTVRAVLALKGAGWDVDPWDAFDVNRTVERKEEIVRNVDYDKDDTIRALALRGLDDPVEVDSRARATGLSLGM